MALPMLYISFSHVYFVYSNLQSGFCLQNSWQPSMSLISFWSMKGLSQKPPRLHSFGWVRKRKRKSYEQIRLIQKLFDSYFQRSLMQSKDEFTQI